MYRPENWEEVKAQLLDGLTPEGAIEAGFDAALIALWKKGRWFSCPSGPDVYDKKLLLFHATWAEAPPVFSFEAVPEIVGVTDDDC